ncbi:hypothetical protein OROGR_022775 [Orobanche gracilis]
MLMLDYTVELIRLASASNSLAVFCFCNLIVAVLLLAGSSKPSIPPSDETERDNNSNCRSDFLNTVDDGRFETIDVVYSSFEGNASTRNDLFENEEEGKVTSMIIDMVVDDTEDDDDDEREEDEEDDDELRKRVEDFIEKINRGWRAEKIRTCSLGQSQIK